MALKTVEQTTGTETNRHLATKSNKAKQFQHLPIKTKMCPQSGGNLRFSEFSVPFESFTRFQSLSFVLSIQKEVLRMERAISILHLINPFIRRAKYPRFLSVSFFSLMERTDSCGLKNILRSRNKMFPLFDATTIEVTAPLFTCVAGILRGIQL